jgi:hypothetical protein
MCASTVVSAAVSYSETPRPYHDHPNAEEAQTMLHTTPRSALLRATLVALIAAGAPRLTAQTTINFDDLGPSLGSGAAVATGYKGLGWSVTNPMGWITQGNTNYTDIVCRSQSNCAYNGFGGITGLTSTAPITLNGWIRRWNWIDNTGSATSVLIEALNAGGTVVGSQTLALSGTFQSFTFSSLFSTLRFTPTGGTGLSCTGANCGYFLLDDLTINPIRDNVVPEPSTYALMVTGFVGLLSMSRGRRRHTSSGLRRLT